MEMTIEEALLKAIEAHKAGNVQEADRFYTAILQAQPKHPDANHNLGILAVGIGKVELALPYLKTALEANPEIEQFWRSYIDALDTLNLASEAIAVRKLASERGIVIHASAQNREKECNQHDSVTKNNANADTIQEPPKEITERCESLFRLCEFATLLQFAEQQLMTYPQSIALLNVQGAANLKLQNHDAALQCYKNALKISPENPYVQFNIGVTLQDMGELEKAAEAYEKAIGIAPEYAEAYNNLGVILRKKGQLQASLEVCQKAANLKPDYADAFNNMGITYSEMGKTLAAIENYQKAIVLNPGSADAYFNFGFTLRNVFFSEFNIDIANQIIELFEFKTLARPSELATPIVSLLRCEPMMKEVIARQHAGKLELNLIQTLTELSSNYFLQRIMRVCPVPDHEIESLLITIRRLALLNLNDLQKEREVVPFLTALAQQCFANEYLYPISAQEIVALEDWNGKISRIFADGKQPDSLTLICLASYRPLHQYAWCKSLLVTKELAEIVKTQIEDHEKELELRGEIPELVKVSDNTSLRVKEQYEVNPYPRWLYLRLERKPRTIKEIARFLNLAISNESNFPVSCPKVLIAGCGTGENALVSASRYANANIVAVDLSFSSLAYALRKTEELGIKKVRYLQTDILELRHLDIQFDLIECNGVLHHMNNPMAGWRELTTLLKPGGLMRIGLYSDLGRQHIMEIRKEIAADGIPPARDEIIAFRASCFNSPLAHRQRVTRTTDFYSLSAVRDLLFHVQEHRFSIPQIQSCLDELGLRFCGFEILDVGTTDKFRKTNTGESDIYDLEKWHEFELANPTIFESMYQFWCQKPVSN